VQHVLRWWERQSDGKEYKKTLRRTPLEELTALPQTPSGGECWLSPPQEPHPPLSALDSASPTLKLIPMLLPIHMARRPYVWAVRTELHTETFLVNYALLKTVPSLITLHISQAISASAIKTIITVNFIRHHCCACSIFLTTNKEVLGGKLTISSQKEQHATNMWKLRDVCALRIARASWCLPTPGAPTIYNIHKLPHFTICQISMKITHCKWSFC